MMPTSTPPRRYEILPLPAHLHPVLVFVNGRSGNQDGTRIARRLRRVLHPLQVRSRRAHASQRETASLQQQQRRFGSYAAKETTAAEGR